MNSMDLGLNVSPFQMSMFMGYLKAWTQKSMLGMTIYLANFLKVVLFCWPDPSLISLIWAPTNASSRIIWYLASYRRYIRDEITYEKKIIGMCVFWLPCQRFSNDRCQIKWQHIFKIYFRNSCRHSDANMECQSVLVRMCEEWRLSLDKGESFGLIAMDLSRAFDSVPHGLLIAKFHAYGASTTACKLLASYLSNLFQRVRLNGNKSEWLPMTPGFPQGSILGPLQLIIFFTDIFHFSEKCNLYNYADDIVCSVAGSDVSSIVSILKSKTQLLVKWFEHNSFQTNPEKFQFMLIWSDRSHYDNIEITIDKSNVKAMPLVKVLGVNIDEHLKFKEHVSSMA